MYETMSHLGEANEGHTEPCPAEELRRQPGGGDAHSGPAEELRGGRPAGGDAHSLCGRCDTPAAKGSSEGLQCCVDLPQPWVQVKQKRTSTQTCTQLFKKPKWASGAEWVKKPWWTHTMKHNLTIRNRLLVITTWNQANRLKWAGKNCIF